MKRVFAALTRFAAVGFVVAGLGFGIQTALQGQPLECPWEPMGHMGECPPGGQPACQELCDLYAPPEEEYYGTCTTGGCCGCLLL